MRPRFTTTAPTIGLGNVRPRPFRASRRVIPRYLTSSAERRSIWLHAAEPVAELPLFCGQVVVVRRVGSHFERDTLHYSNAAEPQSADFFRIVGQQGDISYLQVMQYIGCNPIVTLVGRKTERVIRFHGIKTARLVLICFYFVAKTDAPPFLIQIQEDAATRPLYHFKTHPQLLPAVAHERTERVPRQTLGVDPHQHRLFYVARDERDVFALVEYGVIDVYIKRTVFRRKLRGGLAHDR